MGVIVDLGELLEQALSSLQVLFHTQRPAAPLLRPKQEVSGSLRLHHHRSSTSHSLIGLELELMEFRMAQKPILRVEVCFI